jgi:hypothetical protein
VVDLSRLWRPRKVTIPDLGEVALRPATSADVSDALRAAYGAGDMQAGEVFSRALLARVIEFRRYRQLRSMRSTRRSSIRSRQLFRK